MSKVLYVDESGDLGFDKPGSSNYLVIAYIATENTIRLKRIVRRAKKKARIPAKGEIKGSLLSAEVKEAFLVELGNIPDFEIGAIIVEKAKVRDHLKEKGKQNLLYAYVAGLILLPYLNRNDRCHINFDERTIKTRYGNMIDTYLTIRLATKFNSPNSFAFTHLPSHSCLGLQAADVVANAIWRKYEKGDAEAYSFIRTKIIDEFKPFY